MLKRLFCGIISISMLLVCTGCKKETGAELPADRLDQTENQEQTEGMEQPETASDAGYRRTVLYFVSDEGFVVPVMKMIPWEEGIGKAALNCLVGTEANRASAAQMGLQTVIPDGAAFTLRINNEGEATVDISGIEEKVSPSMHAV